MRTIDVGGATLEARECGAGRARVLVHGSASDHRTWAAQRAAWCDHARVVTYSRRYHWPNEPIEPGATYALEEHVKDLGAVVSDTERVTIPDASHLAHEDDPQRFNAAVDDFLSRRAPT